jgi:hypothetical protein
VAGFQQRENRRTWSEQGLIRSALLQVSLVVPDPKVVEAEHNSRSIQLAGGSSPATNSG